MKIDSKSKIPKEKRSLKSLSLEKPSKNPNLSSLSPKFSNLSSSEQEELLRSMWEKEVGPLPSNFSNLSSSEKEELFRNRLYEKATGLKIDDDKSGSSKNDKEGRELEPVREMHFFHWVLVILFWGCFFWILGQNGCPDTGGGLPMRR